MAEELELKEDSPICLLQDIKKVFQELYDQYRAVETRNKYLEEEIKRIKSEAYKDEELSEMKEKYDKMSKDYYRGFPVSEEESKKISSWIKEITTNDDIKTKLGGAIGGRFHYEFYPTSIGTVGVIVDGNTKERFTFQEL